MTNIVITGASGRMGRALIEATLEAEGASLSGATVRSSSTLVGADAGELVGQGHRPCISMAGWRCCKLHLV